MAEQREQRIGLRGGQRKHELDPVEDVLPGIGIGRGPVVRGVRDVLVTAVDDVLRVVLERAQLALRQQPGNPDEAVAVEVFDCLRQVHGTSADNMPAGDHGNKHLRPAGAARTMGPCSSWSWNGSPHERRGRWRPARCPIRCRVRASCCCGCWPARCAVPTCTWSTANWIHGRRCRGSPATRWSARWRRQDPAAWASRRAPWFRRPSRRWSAAPPWDAPA